MAARRITLIALVAITFFNAKCLSNLLPEKVKLPDHESNPQKPLTDINNLSIEKRHIFRETSSGLSSHGAITRKHRAPSTQSHDVIFVIEQRNMEELTSILHDVSDPKSANYGKHMTSMEIHDLTSNIDSHDQIATYLQGVGAKITQEEHKGEVITARASIEVWEKMFDTEFYVYAFEDNRVNDFTTASVSEIMFIRAEEYSVPVVLHEHIASVLNTIEIPIIKNSRSQSSRIPLTSSAKSSKLLATSLLFDGYVTPQLVNNAYNIDSNVGHPRATQAAYAGFDQYFSPEDVFAFQNEFNLPRQAVNRSIGGFSTSQAWCANNLVSCVEGNLDLQYLIAISNSPTTYYYTSLNSMGMWLQSFVNSINPPLIVSMSYTRDENYVSKGEFNLFQVNAIKLGALGLTLLVAAGDDGVSSPQARGNSRRCGYVPTFPGSCPYVTAVGSTQGIEDYTTEVVSQNDKGGGITSGGGFSTYYPQPHWQNAATTEYFRQVLGTTKAPFPGYSTGRGYPDITCAGSNYLTISGGYLLGVGGTSVSTPVVAGMFSLVNAARLRGGGKPIGWINPTLWGYSDSFVNDVTIGKNNCTASTTCCKQGFSAAVGWDPASGLGSIDYRKFRNFMLKLANIEVPSDPPTASPTNKPTRRPSKSPARPPTPLPSSSAQNFAVSAVPLSLRKPSLAPSKVPTKAPRRVT